MLQPTPSPASAPTPPPPAFVPGPAPRMSSSPPRRAASPAMRALVAAWLVDAAPSSTSAAPPPAAEPGATQRGSLFDRLAVALHLAGRDRDHDRDAPPSAVAVAVASPRRARAARTQEVARKPRGKAGVEAVGVGEASARSRECVSALCASLYSKVTTGENGQVLFDGLPFLGIDESVEGRGMLEAMRQAREQALAAASEKASRKGVGRFFGGIGGALFYLNPLK